MTNDRKGVYPEELLAQERIGNYVKAMQIAECKIVDESLTILARNTFKQKIGALRTAHQRVSKLNVGEAFFPVYNPKTEASVCTISVVEDTTQAQNLDLDVPRIRKAVIAALNEFGDGRNAPFFFRALSDAFLPNNIRFKVSTFGNDSPLPTGRSMELAAAIALISYFFKIPVPDTAAFTGELDDSGRIQPVEEIPLKLEAIQRERPMVTSFYQPDFDEGICKKSSLLSGIITEVFPDFIKQSLQLFPSWKESREHFVSGFVWIDRETHWFFANTCQIDESGLSLQCDIVEFWQGNLKLSDLSTMRGFIDRVVKYIIEPEKKCTIISFSGPTYFLSYLTDKFRLLPLLAAENAAVVIPAQFSAYRKAPLIRDNAGNHQPLESILLFKV